MYKSIAYRGSHIQFLFTDSTTDSTKTNRKTICLTFATIWATLIEAVFRKRYKKDIYEKKGGQDAEDNAKK
jgi:hypothetical protein